MTKRILSLLICLSLLLSMFAMPVWATEETEEPAVPTAGEFGIVGEWIWGETVAELGADEVVARCAENGVTDIYLLVKGTGGMLGYNKTQYTENITRENRDVLQETIDAAHAENIRVHTWLVALNDTDYKAKNPEAGNWHFVRERDNDFLAAYNEGYREYMKNIVTEIVTNYDVDGIHLDYIRYNHACNGWSEEDFANLEAMGADIENVKYLIRKTFYQNQLEETDIVDADYIFNAYRNGDKDALLIAQYRRNNVTDFGMMIRDTALAINPDLVISGAIMPEGIYDPAFSDIHYGQNYEDCAKLYDYVVPMAYADTYGYSSAKMAEMVEQAIEKGNKVVMGFQSYYPTKSEKLQSDIEAIRALLPNEGVLGICHFRHSQFSYAKMYTDLEAGLMKVQAINTYNDGGWRWVQFEAAEGVTFTGAKMLEGFAADVPVEIAEDGSWIKIGYADDAAEEALPTLAWGKLEITFEGAPVDPDARIAYARIWINSNESRAYNVYEEGLPTTVTFVDGEGEIIEVQYVKEGEEPEYPDYPLLPGYKFIDWEETTDENGDVTIAPTYREIAPVEVYGDMEIAGDWIWGSDVAALGADTIAERSAKNGITDIYLLVKGVGGTLGFNKTKYTENITRERDVLQEMIDCGHAAGIRVHAWLVTDQDETYKANNPDSGMWHYKRARDNENITPYDEGYNAYMADIATELATNYEIDGIHLDYIRYNHLCNGWSEVDFANLEAMGANIENVRYLINKTFYADLLPEGEEVDADYIFNAYRNGDPDATLIAEYRRQNVVNLAKTIIDTAEAINPDLIMSAAFMPEGAVYEGSADKAFADLHYGQNYADGAELYDYIIPMAYSASYGYSPEDMAQIAKNVVGVGAKVVMGLQSNYPTTSVNLTEEIEAIRLASLETEGILGICHFRHTMFSYAKFTYDYFHGTMDLDIINTYASAGYKWVQVDAAEGVKFTGAEYGEGFVADAPIEIAEDGSYVKFGYASEGEDFIIGALEEGNLKLTFEGEPADRKAPIAIARIYITNESRAYNVYNDITPVTHFVTFKDFDGTVIDTIEVIEGTEAVIDNPLRAGYRFMGWDADVSAVTEDMTVTATYREIAPMEQYGDFEIVGEWIHGSDVADLGADTIVERCAKNGITDIYLLVKGTGGTLGYNKTQYTENITRERDVLQEMITMGHSVGIRVHAWLVTVEDSAYKAEHPEAGIWHYVRAQDNDRINPYDEGYQTYMANIATEIATGYEVDGIHLDYIRYNHACNGWSETDFANLEAMGANIDNVKALIERTFYGVDGAAADNVSIFEAYRNGDPDALLIAQYRRQNVVELAKVIIDAAKAVNPDLIMSAALMPEGAVTEGNDDIAFADIHYGQNYEDAAELYDYVCPMAYTGSYADGSPEWFANIAKTAVEKGNKVVMGTQAYYPAMSTNLTEEVEAVRQLLPNENILGIIHFRHTQFSYAKFNYAYNDGSMTVDIINTYASAGYKWVQIDAAEGVKFTAAEYGEGFVADAPIEIAEDGSYVKFGYTDDAEDFIIGALAEGSLKLTFEGSPEDYNAPVAIARIYITNESRAFNVYNDLTEYTHNFVGPDGEIIDTQVLPRGEEPTMPEGPVWEGYEFVEWYAEKGENGVIAYYGVYSIVLPFEDVNENDWFYNDVYYVYAMGYMNGIEKTIFAPEKSTTRAMMATVLYRMAGSPSVEGKTTPFVDIIEGSWYYDAVVWGYNEGVIKGTSSTTFAPDRNVTREQLVALMYRFAGAEASEADLSAYPDADAISKYAREAFAWAIENGIINGVKNSADGSITLKPGADATRAQVAAMLTRFDNYLWENAPAE